MLTDNVNALLFYIEKERKYSRIDLLKYPFKVIHEEVNIKNCRFYDLRGICTTKNLKNGVEIRDVADILEHSKIEETENYDVPTT